MFRISKRYRGALGEVRCSQGTAGARMRNQTVGVALKYVSEGVEHYRLGKGEVEVSAGEFTILPQGQEYEAFADRRISRTQGVCIDLAGDFVLAGIPDLYDQELLFGVPLRVQHYLQLPEIIAGFAEQVFPSVSQEEAQIDHLRKELRRLVEAIKKSQRGLVVLLSLFLVVVLPACAQHDSWETQVEQFVTDYEQLDLPYLRIAYIDNLEAMPSLVDLERQTAVLAKLRTTLAQTDRADLNEKQQLDYDLLKYQLPLHEERIALERQWWKAPPTIVATEGLAQFINGKAWYRYFLKRWLDGSVRPESMFDFGLEEIAKVKARMREVQLRSGLDSLEFQQYIHSDAFLIKDTTELKAAFTALRARLRESLPAYFPGMDGIPPVDLRRNTEERLGQVPGFYRDNTFYYNIFNGAFNRREIVWMFLHEAIPGHHYERSYSASLPQTAVQELFDYPAYAEGWGAYVEEIGKEIGAYQNLYDELGKWEWDIIRSVRVPLDIGLNYYGWSDERALDFWQQHISGKDDIAAREIARMKRWPCQVITYKYGADKILRWKAERAQDPDFNLLDFHTEMLRRGPLPFSLLADRLSKATE